MRYERRRAFNHNRLYSRFICFLKSNFKPSSFIKGAGFLTKPATCYRKVSVPVLAEPFKR